MDFFVSGNLHRYPLTAFFLLLYYFSTGQHTITGKIQDRVSTLALSGVTVKLIKNDSTIQSASTNAFGLFTIKNVKNGTYIVRTSIIGYQSLDSVVKAYADLQLKMDLESSEIALEEIEITATPAASIRGDTTEFDAKKFSTREFADADELVAQIPGVELDEEGNVKAHGEEVTKIIVDGKEFFSTDPRIALKTLPAEIIDKIQLIDEKSEQAKFSGFDDGNRRKVINIVTKPDRRRGTFGKASSGYGDHQKFALNSSLNRFDGDHKLAVNLMANNVNETNFAEQGRGGSRRGNNNTERGLTDTYAGAINYNNVFLEKKMDVSADYNVKSSGTDVVSNSDIEYILGNRANQFQQQAQLQHNKETAHKANARVRWNIDSMQRLDFSPNLSYQSVHRIGSNNSSMFLNRSDLLNRSTRKNDHENGSFIFGGELTYMYRFRKAGRTVSLNVGGNKNSNDALGKNLALTEYYKDGLLNRLDTNNNQSITNGYGSGFNGRLSLTENISKRSRLQANYSLRNTRNYSDRQTFEWLAETGQLGELNARLSNEFKNDYLYHRAGMSYAYNKKDSLRFQVGLSYQHGVRNNDRTFPINLLTRADFGSFHPEFSLTYNINKERRLELQYHTDTNTPSINQLQDYINNQNELRISNGNPDLDQEYNHNLKVQYKDVKRASGQSFNSSFDFNYTNDKIVNSVLTTDTAVVLFDGIVLGAGGQYTVPINVDGAYGVRWTNSFGIPIKMWKLNLNLNNTTFYNSNFAVLNHAFLNGYNYGIQQRIGVHSNINKKFVSGINYRLNLTYTNNPIATVPTYKVYSHTVNHTLTYEFFRALVFHSSLLYIYNSGVLGDPGTKTLLWNASLGAKFLKRKNAAVSLKAFDIFNDAQNINRRLTDISITDVTSNTLTRYFMLSVNYNLRHFNR
ncbi:outer membrane beta-barrel protein [Sphingobacterium suaedae]|uniref:Outer membrane beta-barrel protein n=1 Tax=Sphingobacterium suaedae TaxID=1686402 RepID=A0ABW5KN11_9SPHI